MKKKLIVCLALAVLMVVALAFAACDTTPTDECKHVYKDVAEKAATCLTAGNKAYQECIYCGKLFIDGKEVTQNDVTIPADENAHKLTDVAEIPATCVKEGVKAYQKCEVCSKTFIDGKEVKAADLVIAINPNAHKLSDVAAKAPTCVVDGLSAHQECDHCHKMFLNNAEVTEESLKIAARGYHDWNAEGTCKDCGAYKISYNGKDYAVDDSNIGSVTAWSDSGLRHKATDFSEFTKALFANGNLWGVQITSAQAQNHVKASFDENGNLFVSQADSIHIHTNYWKDGKPFIGKFIMTFTVTTADDVNMEKYGLGLVTINADGKAVSVEREHSKSLVGSSANEADGTYRTIEANKPVTFTYLVTISDAKQIIRMTWYNELKAQTDTTLTNLHFIPVEEAQEGATPAPADVELLEVSGAKMHEHTYSTEWKCNESQHWHETTCGHTGFNADTDAHTFNDQDTCTICGYKKQIVHEHNIVDGVCTTCNMTNIAIEIPTGGTGTSGKKVLPLVKDNPGKITAQTKSSGSTATLNNGALDCVINSNDTEKTNTIFLRTIVAKDGAAYVGKYTFSLDITVTKGKGNAKDATSIDVYLGFFLQELKADGTANNEEGASIKEPGDSVYTLVVGKTYRFSVEVETTNALQYLQFNARQTAGNGVEFTLSNLMVSFQETATPATAATLTYTEVALPVQKQTTAA